VLAASADGFYIRHIEYTPVVLAAQGAPAAGAVVVAHYSQSPPEGALMFSEDPQTQDLVTGGLCMVDDGGRSPSECYCNVTTVTFARWR